MDITKGPWPLIFGILAALGGIGGLGGLGALLVAKSQGKKNEADAAGSIVNAATALVAPLQGEVGRLTTRVGVLESDAAIQRQLLVEHSVWDHLALARMTDANVELPPVPPLFPPVRHTPPLHQD